MSSLRGLLALPFLAAAALGVAVWTGDQTLATFCAATAAALTGAFLLLAIREEVRWDLPAPPEVEGDPLVRLGKSFREGAFGRRTILARLAAIDWVVPADPAERIREEAEILRASDEAFLDYLEGRIADVERRT